MSVDLTNVFCEKKVILLGAGVSNMPLARMLSKMGAKIEVRDKKTVAELGEAGEELVSLGASLVLGDEYLSPMEGDFVFRSPGFRPDIPVLEDAKKKGICVTGEMEMFIEKAPCPVIGITGSDGKSTTTTLVSKILEKQNDRKVFLGGNIGEPLLHRVSDMDENSIVAAELSSFQLMTVSAPVTVAVIKNVTPNHLNWHTGMDEYIEAKARILKGAKRAVLSFDDEVCRSLAKDCDCPVMWFSRKPIPEDVLKACEGGVYPKDGYLVCYLTEKGREEKVVALSDILLPGEHNIENYSTAIAATLGYADKESVADVARTFGGVRHRLELVREKDGVRYYNSSIDSSPTRTAAAISALTCPINIICGGYDKNIPFEPLADALIAAKNIKSVVLTGATLEKIKASLLAHPDFEASGIKLLEKPDFKEAVLCSASLASEGECVLLSPACASFDAFKNFEVRGEAFKDIVFGI
ncbi:MAG: UDP-N-acetylmuramoyl-L-alanine--D-glutamate ligase [Clostridia bacterium]|nr:UDP-N-acetylmuramoyl-L-alanine--D-glutamate ligase [Clostridia bacterium]